MASLPYLTIKGEIASPPLNSEKIIPWGSYRMMTKPPLTGGSAAVEG
jgi:hypothetical protein